MGAFVVGECRPPGRAAVTDSGVRIGVKLSHSSANF